MNPEKKKPKIKEILIHQSENRITLKNFKTELQKVGIPTEEYYTKTGDIFGISFIDTFSNTKFKGSELEKSIS